jgi:hypothetical protein
MKPSKTGADPYQENAASRTSDVRRIPPAMAPKEVWRRSDSHLVGLLGTISAGTATGVFSIWCLVLVGWVFDLAVFKSLNPRLVSMKANTAAAFALAGSSFWLSQAVLHG